MSELFLSPDAQLAQLVADYPDEIAEGMAAACAVRDWASRKLPTSLYIRVDGVNEHVQLLFYPVFPPGASEMKLVLATGLDGPGTCRLYGRDSIIALLTDRGWDVSERYLEPPAAVCRKCPQLLACAVGGAQL